MTFSSKNFIFILFFMHGAIQAARWPWTVIPVSSPLSTKKRAMRSRVNINKTVASDRKRYLFSDEGIFKDCSEQYCLEDVCANARKTRTTVVRVLLAECDANASVQWNFTSRQGFALQAINSNDNKSKKTLKVTKFSVTGKRGSLFYNGKRLKHAIRLRSLCGYGELNGIAYDGDFCIIPYKNGFLCINQVELEDYITAVLRTESWPGWPLEVNKVFAIACRSYVSFKILEAKRSGRPFHVKNSNAHQTYQGRHDLPILKAAVKETKGVVLGFQGKPILAMFDCCCGGIIPAHIADFDFHKVPYLARTYACNHCKQSSLYQWQVSYDHAAFDTLLNHYKHEISWLHDIHIIKKDKAGLVTEVRLKGPKNNAIVSGKKLYSLLKEVKSFHFDVHKKAGKIVFTGRGFGHHIGLCQWGARQMVRDGRDYKSILRFYYPGTYFMRLL